MSTIKKANPSGWTKRLTVLGFLVAAILVVMGAARFRFNGEILDVLPPQIEAVEGLKLFQKNFSSGQELIIAIEADTADVAEAAASQIAKEIQAKTNLVSTVTWKPPWLENPADSAELIGYLWMNQAPEVFATLTNRLAEGRSLETLQGVKEQLATSFSPSDIGMLSYDPFSLMKLPETATSSASMKWSDEFFSSGDGRFRIVTVEPKTALLDYKECRKWLETIKGTVQQLRENDPAFKDVRVRFTGRPAFFTEISSGMKRDLMGTSAGTLLFIAGLFYLTHRRILPLVWLVFLLILILGTTIALGGLLLGVINVISIGFASILLGLAEDFGIVLYQESQTHPTHSVQQIRKEAAPGIIWSAITCAGAFGMLTFSSLPGMAQLGAFVAIGVLVAAALMLFWYLTPLKRFSRGAAVTPDSSRSLLLFETSKLLPNWLIWVVTFVVIGSSVFVILITPPAFDRSPDPLRPKKSEAYDTLAAVKNRLSQGAEPFWVVIRGDDEAEVAQRTAKLKSFLEGNKQIESFAAPDVLWPNPNNQMANRPLLRTLLGREKALEAEATAEGFEPRAIALTRNVFETWRRAEAQNEVFWPTNRLSRWVLKQVTARSGAEHLALALVQPKAGLKMDAFVANWPKEFRAEGIILSGWELLGSAVFQIMLKEMPYITAAIFVLVLVCLWAAFRSIREVILSFAMLGFSGLALIVIMYLLGWKWNLLNMVALPMLLGMGVDFSIHTQLALIKANGDLLYVRRSIGKALLLAGSTTVVGFGALAFSSNSGMASLGKTCGLGIIIALLTAVYLLPVWWVWTKSFSRVPQRR